MSFPKVSILIPLYNCELYIEEAVESVLNQTFQDFELIIVDNCSTDNSFGIIQKYTVDSRVRIYRNETNIGMARNWNQCLLYSAGEYIKFLCSDDILYPEALAEFVQVLDSNTGVSVVTSYRNIKTTELKEFKLPIVGLQQGNIVTEESLLTYNWIGEPTSLMFRRRDLNVGYFKTDLKWLIDWDMWLRLLTVGDCFIIPKVLTCFRLHEGQGTVQLRKKSLDKFEEYYFLKSVKDFNLYGIGNQSPRINNRIKQKALECGKTIPFLRKIKEKDLAIDAVNIIRESRLFWKFLLWCLNNAKKTILWFLYNYFRH